MPGRDCLAAALANCYANPVAHSSSENHLLPAKKQTNKLSLLLDKRFRHLLCYLDLVAAMAELARFWDEEVLATDLGAIHAPGSSARHSLFESDLFAVGETLESFANVPSIHQEHLPGLQQLHDNFDHYHHQQQQHHHHQQQNCHDFRPYSSHSGQLTQSYLPSSPTHHASALSSHSTTFDLSPTLPHESPPKISTLVHLNALDASFPEGDDPPGTPSKNEQPWRSFMDHNCPLRRRVKVTITPSKKRTPAKTVCGKRVLAVDDDVLTSSLDNGESCLDIASRLHASDSSSSLSSKGHQPSAKRPRKSAMRMQSTLCFTPAPGDCPQPRFHLDIRRSTPTAMHDAAHQNGRLGICDGSFAMKRATSKRSKKSRSALRSANTLAKVTSSKSTSYKTSPAATSQPLLSYVVPPVGGHPIDLATSSTLPSSETAMKILTTNISDHRVKNKDAGLPVSTGTSWFSTQLQSSSKQEPSMQNEREICEFQSTSPAERRSQLLDAIRYATESAKAAAIAATARSSESVAGSSGEYLFGENSKNAANIARKRCSGLPNQAHSDPSFVMTKALQARIIGLTSRPSNQDPSRMPSITLSSMQGLRYKALTSPRSVRNTLATSLPCADAAVVAVAAAASRYNARLMCPDGHSNRRSRTGRRHRPYARKISAEESIDSRVGDNMLAVDDPKDNNSALIAEDFEYVERECALQLYLADS